MPIYEYQCGSCNHQLEEMQKLSEEPLTHCPECGKESLKKIVSHTSFQLKGTGWYATDFKDKGKPKPAEAAKTEDKPPTDSGAAKPSDSSSSSQSATE